VIRSLPLGIRIALVLPPQLVVNVKRENSNSDEQENAVKETDKLEGTFFSAPRKVSACFAPNVNKLYC
jgi:hypothetical protein